MALDLLIRRPELVAGTVLVEPPVLQLLPMATEALSGDRRRLETAAGAGEDVIDVYLSGGLAALGAGVSRLPGGIDGRRTGAARERDRRDGHLRRVAGAAAATGYGGTRRQRSSPLPRRRRCFATPPPR